MTTYMEELTGIRGPTSLIKQPIQHDGATFYVTILTDKNNYTIVVRS